MTKHTYRRTGRTSDLIRTLLIVFLVILLKDGYTGQVGSQWLIAIAVTAVAGFALRHFLSTRAEPQKKEDDVKYENAESLK